MTGNHARWIIFSKLLLLRKIWWGVTLKFAFYLWKSLLFYYSNYKKQINPLKTIKIFFYTKAQGFIPNLSSLDGGSLFMFYIIGNLCLTVYRKIIATVNLWHYWKLPIKSLVKFFKQHFWNWKSAKNWLSYRHFLDVEHKKHPL